MGSAKRTVGRWYYDGRTSSGECEDINSPDSTGPTIDDSPSADDDGIGPSQSTGDTGDGRGDSSQAGETSGQPSIQLGRPGHTGDRTTDLGSVGGTHGLFSRRYHYCNKLYSVSRRQFTLEEIPNECLYTKSELDRAFNPTLKDYLDDDWLSYLKLLQCL